MLPDLVGQENKWKVETVADFAAEFKTQPATVRQLFSEVGKLTRLLLVAPATSCCSERSFSELRRLKTWMRSTMTQKRLTHLALSNCHQEKVECINIDDLCKQFVSRTKERQITFGEF